MKSTDVLMFVAVVAVVLASINLIITINKIGDFKVLSGFATDTGVANLSITAFAIVNFSYDDTLDWGTGSVEGTNTSLELTSGGIMNGSGFTNITDGLVIVNIGNTDVNLNLSSSKNAADFIGGSLVTPKFQWNVTNNESGSCDNTGGGPYVTNISAWTEVCTSSACVRACDNFTWRPNNNELEIDLRIVIPSDAVGTKGVTITANAQAYV